MQRVAGASDGEETVAELDSSAALLERHTFESLGGAPADRNVRIMATMPSEAAKILHLFALS